MKQFVFLPIVFFILFFVSCEENSSVSEERKGTVVLTGELLNKGNNDSLVYLELFAKDFITKEDHKSILSVD